MRSARILIVDDEPGMLRAVERVLSADHHVAGTRSSRDALSVAAEFHPELAIVDIRMPDLDGFELMARLKARFPGLDVILMTGSVDDLDEKLVRDVNAGHPSLAVWGPARKPMWMESTGPLVSPVLSAHLWNVAVVPIDEGDQLLLYTDGVSEVLADADGCADARFTNTIERVPSGGGSLLDAILADVQHDLAGTPQPDDLTLLTAKVLGRTDGISGASRSAGL